MGDLNIDKFMVVLAGGLVQLCRCQVGDDVYGIEEHSHWLLDTWQGKDETQLMRIELRLHLLAIVWLGIVREMFRNCAG